jgi:signal transduction histidine kinase
MDAGLRYTAIAGAAQARSGFESYLGKSIWEVPHLLPSGSWDDLRATMAARKTFRDFECRHDGPDGPVVHLSVSGTPILAEEGGFRGYRGTGRDITVKKRAEELAKALAASEESSRTKSAFVATMSHELRTPLNSVIGFTELVHAGEAGPISPTQRHYLDNVLGSGRQLLRLINDVLELARVESGEMELHPEPLDVGLLLGEVVSGLRPSAEQSRIQIRMEVDESIGHVVADPARLKQVLYNYLSNALKFTPAGGSVVVRARAQGPDAFALEVEDTGVGIKPEDLTRLFVAFQQLDSGHARKYGGTGLGLAVTKRLVEAQGGSVGVRSTPGQGSVFQAILPRRPRGAATA